MTRGGTAGAAAAVAVLVAAAGCSPERQEQIWGERWGLALVVRNFSGETVDRVDHWKCDTTRVRRMVLPQGGLEDGEEEHGFLPGPGCYEFRAWAVDCFAETATVVDLEPETTMTWNLDPGVIDECE